MVERVDDLYLPLATVNRFIKSNLPEGVALSKEARLAVSRAASIFVLYCTAAANDIAQHADRRTILPNDVLGALHDMDFAEFVKPLQSALDDFKKTNASHKTNNENSGGRAGSSASKKKATSKKGGGGRKKQKPTSDGGVGKNSDGATPSNVIDLEINDNDEGDDEGREGEPARINSADLASPPDEEMNSGDD